MRAPVIILGILLPTLGAYTISTQLNGGGDRRMDSNPSEASPVPYETKALAGSWSGFSKNGAPIRLVVKDVRSEWALVRLAVGKTAEGADPQGSMWARAKVLPDGRLCISYPLHLVFTLAEDSRSLVGTKVHADPLASVLLARTEEEHPTIALSR